MQYHCKSSFLALYSQGEHRRWASTWFLVTAWTTDKYFPASAHATNFSMFSDGSTDHKYQQHSLSQHGPGYEINMASRQYAPQTQIWFLVASWPMDIIRQQYKPYTSGDSSGLWHQHASASLHGTCTTQFLCPSNASARNVASKWYRKLQ